MSEEFDARELQESYMLKIGSNVITFVQRCVGGNFVGPGFPKTPEYTKEYLREQGAILSYRYGWIRKFQEVKS